MNLSLTRREDFKKWTLEIICLSFIFLFTYAAISKLLDVQKFRNQLGQSPMLSFFAPVVSWSIPILEILISLMLAFPKWRLQAMYASFGLMISFSAYIVVITRFTEYVPCSCGGILEKMNWNQHLVFNCVFVALALGAIIMYPISESSANKNIVKDYA